MNLGSENNLHSFRRGMARSSSPVQDDPSDSSNDTICTPETGARNSPKSASQGMISSDPELFHTEPASSKIKPYSASESLHQDNIQKSGQNSLDSPSSARNGLMSVLSGSQNHSRKAKSRREKKHHVEHVPELPELQELENKVFSSQKSVSAMELLQKRRISPAQTTVAVSDEPDTEGSSISAIIGRYPAKKRRNLNGCWSLKVCLKVPPHALRLIATPPAYFVTLKLPRDTLLEMLRRQNPLYTSGSGFRTGKESAPSVFDMMMKRASENSNPKLTPIQKLRGLEPPAVPRDAMHVTGSPPPKPVPVRPRRPPADLAAVVAEKSDFGDGEPVPPAALVCRPANIAGVDAHIRSRCPLALTSAPHMAVARMARTGVAPAHNWPQQFRPQTVGDLLVPSRQKNFLSMWLANSFEILRTQSTKVSRSVKIREKKRRKDSFIVNDSYLEWDDEDTDEDTHVPVLIIHGGSGVGKTAAVYAAMQAIDGYVHEINTGQPRARKDLLSSLKEFCTTQIIQKNAQKKTSFQQGVVLFEDCDVLFEQDKTFWSVVQEVMNYSKRPLVLTVQDLGVVPRGILDVAEDQNSVLGLELESRDALMQYLWLCCFAAGYDVADAALADIVQDDPRDLRRALMQCQWLCPRRSGHVTVDRLPRPARAPASLHEACSQMETLSAGDIIAANTPSALAHEQQPNELLDVCVLDDSAHLRQATLPHELNIGHVMTRDHEHEAPMQDHHFNSLRWLVIGFFSSRARKMPRYSQARLPPRSRSDAFGPDLQNLPENSFCYSVTPGALYADVAPFARKMALFQKLLEQKEARDGPSTGFREAQYLGWRQFHRHVDEILETAPRSCAEWGSPRHVTSLEQWH